MARGAGEENIMIMCLVFILAGAFSSSVKAAGGADATVNFGLSILPGSVAVVGVFVIGCFIRGVLRQVDERGLRTALSHGMEEGSGRDDPAGS